MAPGGCRGPRGAAGFLGAVPGGGVVVLGRAWAGRAASSGAVRFPAARRLAAIINRERAAGTDDDPTPTLANSTTYTAVVRGGSSGAEGISGVERLVLKTQVNKHTERHIGVLRAKLSKLKLQIIGSYGNKNELFWTFVPIFVAPPEHQSANEEFRRT